MNIRKIKKQIKNHECDVFKKQSLKSLKLIIVWSRSKHIKSKSNMKILTQNFWYKGKFII
jgi:hypothetical protein